MTTPCAMCRARGKTWNGSDPTCSFPDGGSFQADGWNCATANAIRDVCGSAGAKERIYGTYAERDSDQSIGLISLMDIEFKDDEFNPRSLWVAWYKHRGRTDAMWLLFDELRPRLPTEADCLRILNSHRYRALGVDVPEASEP